MWCAPAHPRSWISLYQRDPALWRPCMSGKISRDYRDYTYSMAWSRECAAAHSVYSSSTSVEEAAAFGYALHSTMDLWYAHQGTTVMMLTQLPEGSARTTGYDDSGWTFYERCSAEQIKQIKHATPAKAKRSLVIDLGQADEGQQRVARRWPIGPDDFDKMVDGKAFASGADCQVK